MTAQIIPVPVFDLVVFGATGDLGFRKLMPALYWRERPADARGSRIVGGGPHRATTADYVAQVEAACRRHVDGGFDEGVFARLAQRILTCLSTWPSRNVRDALAPALVGGEDRPRLFYLATSPDLFGPICHGAGAAGIVTPMSRVVLEKPIGRDLASAIRINDEVGEVFDERQVYRIDHYLGKEIGPEPAGAALRQLAVRAGLEPGAHRPRADHGGRDRWRRGPDHLLRPRRRPARHGPEPHPPASVPSRDGAADHHGGRRGARREAQSAAVLARHRRRRGAAEDRARAVSRRLRRGGRGAVLRRGGGHPSRTETFVAIKAEVENWRWAGTPFYLRTGKRLPSRVSEIVIQFHKVPHSIFPPGVGVIEPGRLVIRLQPDDGIRSLMVKDPGPGGMRLRLAPLDIRFADAFKVRYRTRTSACSWTWSAATPPCSCGATRSRRRGGGSSRFSTPGRRATRRPSLHRRELGPDGRDRPDRTRRPHLVRGRTLTGRPTGFTGKAHAPAPRHRRGHRPDPPPQRSRAAATTWSASTRPPRAGAADSAVVRQPRPRLRRLWRRRQGAPRRGGRAGHCHRHRLQRHALGPSALRAFPRDHPRRGAGVGAVAQVAGGVPAMCDGVTRARSGWSCR